MQAGKYSIFFLGLLPAGRSIFVFFTKKTGGKALEVFATRLVSSTEPAVLPAGLPQMDQMVRPICTAGWGGTLSAITVHLAKCDRASMLAGQTDSISEVRMDWVNSLMTAFALEVRAACRAEGLLWWR